MRLHAAFLTMRWFATGDSKERKTIRDTDIFYKWYAGLELAIIQRYYRTLESKKAIITDTEMVIEPQED